MKISKHAKLFLVSAVGLTLSLSPPFITVGQAQSSASPAASPQDASWEKEFTLWRKATRSGKSEDYAAYLKAYPAGKFVKVAQSRMEALKAAAEPEAKPPAQVVAKVAPEAAKPTPVKPVIAEAKPAAVAPQIEPEVAQAPKVEVPQIAQKGAAMPTPAIATKPTTQWEQEYALWKAAAQGNTVTEYKAYLKSFPEGKFAAIAQSRIAALAAAEKPVAAIVEGDDNVAPAEEAPSDEPPNENADNAPVADDAEPEPDQQAQDSQPVENNLARKPAPRVEDNGATEEATQDNGRRRAPLMAGDEYGEDQALDREGHSEMQGRLSSLGFETGGADGVFGPRTRSAIAAWQEANDAPVSGYLSDDQIEVIRQQSEQAYAAWLSEPSKLYQSPVYRERRPVYEAEERVIIRDDPVYVRRPVIIERVRPRILVEPGYVYRPRRYVNGPVIVIGPRTYVRKCRERDRQRNRCR